LRIFGPNGLRWAPDGDGAFDDDSYAIQFDVESQVRLIAFRCGEDGLHDPATLSDVWLKSETYYSVLERWHESFNTEWVSLPKESS